MSQSLFDPKNPMTLVVGVRQEDAYNALRSPLSRLRTKLREAVGRNVLSRHEDDGIRFMPGGTGARWKDTSKRAPMPQS